MKPVSAAKSYAGVTPASDGARRRLRLPAQSCQLR
jgi:hypothetical protein